MCFDQTFCRHIIYYLRWFSRHHWPIWVLTLRRFCKFQIIVDSFGLSVIYSFAIYWTHLAYLSFAFLSPIGHFWLFCHLQFCNILDTFCLSVMYSFVPDRTLLVYLSFTVFSQIRCIGLTYHLQVLPQITHICTLFI